MSAERPGFFGKIGRNIALAYMGQPPETVPANIPERLRSRYGYAKIEAREYVDNTFVIEDSLFYNIVVYTVTEILTSREIDYLFATRRQKNRLKRILSIATKKLIRREFINIFEDSFDKKLLDEYRNSARDVARQAVFLNESNYLPQPKS